MQVPIGHGPGKAAEKSPGTNVLGPVGDGGDPDLRHVPLLGEHLHLAQ
jgi:hypothetical protein